LNGSPALGGGELKKGSG